MCAVERLDVGFEINELHHDGAEGAGACCFEIGDGAVGVEVVYGDVGEFGGEF